MPNALALHQSPGLFHKLLTVYGDNGTAHQGLDSILLWIDSFSETFSGQVSIGQDPNVLVTLEDQQGPTLNFSMRRLASRSEASTAKA
jgi:hypothetical protein